MRRTGGDKQVCYVDLDEALAACPETYGHLDLIAFGFPCQDISFANSKGKGLAGDKSSLFHEAIRVVRLLMPQWVLIENVPALLYRNGGRDFGVVLKEVAESGYGYCWNVLDSQWFGVPQRRKRLFVAGRFGKVCPAEILSEPKGRCRHRPEDEKVRQTGLCLHTRTGQRQNPTSETYIANPVLTSDYKKLPHGQYGNECNLIAGTVTGYRSEYLPPSQNRQYNLIANTVKTSDHASPNLLNGDNINTEADTERKGEVTGPARGLDNARGIVIGNGITVPVIEWIGKRIIEFMKNENERHTPYAER